MNSSKNEGGLQYSFRTITREQNEAELAAATQDDSDVIGLTADQLALRNRATTGETSKATSTSDLLAESLKRVQAGQAHPKRDVEVTDRKVTEPAAEPEPTYSTSAAALALNSAIRKAREAREKSQAKKGRYHPIAAPNCRPLTRRTNSHRPFVYCDRV
jgi:hypothetical protein